MVKQVKCRKASISSRNLVDAVLRVERMSFRARKRFADEIHARHPTSSTRCWFCKSMDPDSCKSRWC